MVHLNILWWGRYWGCTRRIKWRSLSFHVDRRFMCCCSLMLHIVSHLESNFHMIWLAPASNSSIEVVRGWRGDEIIVFARRELHAPGSGSEGTKGYGEVHEFMWLVAHGNHSRMRLRDATRLILIFGYAVDHWSLFLLLGCMSVSVDRAYDIHLIILPRLISPVHINNVISVINAKNRVGCVPVDVVALFDGLEAINDTATEKEYQSL